MERAARLSEAQQETKTKASLKFILHFLRTIISYSWQLTYPCPVPSVEVVSHLPDDS